MNGGVQTTAATVDRAVYRTEGISESCLSQSAWTPTMRRRREQNLLDAEM